MAAAIKSVKKVTISSSAPDKVPKAPKEPLIPPRKKTPHFFDLAFTYQHRCVGEKVTRSIWLRPDCYWSITKVVPKLSGAHGQFRRGNVWGFFTWRGITEPKLRKITSLLKRQWHIYDPTHYERVQKKHEQMVPKVLAPETIMGLKSIPKNPPIKNRSQWVDSKSPS